MTLSSCILSFECCFKINIAHERNFVEHSNPRIYLKCSFVQSTLCFAQGYLISEIFMKELSLIFNSFCFQKIETSCIQDLMYCAVHAKKALFSKLESVWFLYHSSFILSLLNVDWCFEMFTLCEVLVALSLISNTSES